MNEPEYVNKQDVRWIQRFQNFDRAFSLLRQALMEKELSEYNMLEKEGLAQRFEYTYELAWKTLKDYLIENGVSLREGTPREIIKSAFAVGIISDGQAFIDMMLSRNILSHCYDFEKFNDILQIVKEKYLDPLNGLHKFLIERLPHERYRVDTK